MILDGWGWREEKNGNAIAIADTPNWDKILKKYPYTTIKASGMAVGLPEGTMGNSEVGHLNIGAGRVVYQEFTRINKSIEDGDFFKNKILKKTFADLKKSGGTLHLMGLCSDIGVHSHLNHLYALIDLAVGEGIKNVRIHCFTDGRDSPPDSGLAYIKQIEDKIQDVERRTLACQSSSGGPNVVRIATVIGRYYAMDRDRRWDRIERAYSAIVDGVGKKYSSAIEAIEASYKEGVTDEFIVPTVIEPLTPATKSSAGRQPSPPPNNRRTGTRGEGVNDNDVVIFFNFRADRARQLTRAMTDAGLGEFKRRVPRLSNFVTMTQYDEKFALPVVFSPERMKNIFGEIISKGGLTQLRIAETEKYAHVTYFFNGGEEKIFKNEDRCLIPSPRDVPTYDKKPQMSAFEVTDEVVKRANSDRYDVIILNFANPDMVGHTGILEAAVKAVEAVDKCIGRILDVVLQKNGAILIMSDHGNCEEMIDERGEPQTAHTTDLVPFILIGNGYERAKLKTGGALCDVAPTMLELLKIKKPADMTGSSLINRSS